MTQTTPLVSVLVPVYNVERYLRECLGSLEAQTFTDFEAIVIDDGSTDGSAAIAREFQERDGRFRVVSKANSGYGASMNRGLAEARGTYVAILESDDVMEPDALEVLTGAASDFDAQVVKADFSLYWSVPEERLEPFGLLDGIACGTVVDTSRGHEIYLRKASIWSALYSKAFLDENGIRFLETPGASFQDTSFTFKVWACATRVVFVDRPVLRYRQDNEQSSVRSPGKMYCVMDEFAEIDRFLGEDPARAAALDDIEMRVKYDAYLWNCDRLDPSLRPAFLERASAELKDDLAKNRADFSHFEVWREADLRALADDPVAFARWRDEGSTGKLATAKRYLGLGGLPLLAKMLAEKVRP